MKVRHHDTLSRPSARPVSQSALQEAEEAALQARAELDQFLATERSYDDYYHASGGVSTPAFLGFCGGPILGMFLASKIKTGPAAWITLAACAIGIPALSLHLSMKGKKDSAQQKYDQAQTIKQNLVTHEQSARQHRDQLYQQNLEFLKTGERMDEIEFEQDEDYLIVGGQILPRNRD